jgi:hypothetical protein
MLRGTPFKVRCQGTCSIDPHAPGFIESYFTGFQIESEVV